MSLNPSDLFPRHLEIPGLTDLPIHLMERARWIGEHKKPFSGDFILYWMRTALRAHENPALDLALELGRRLDRSVFVYHGLSQRYPFASDRHHWFILEGARDVQQEMDRRGIGYAFQLERPGSDGPYLRLLAERAAMTVTEDMPVAPLHGWTRSLATAVPGPVLAVDTACVVPMNLMPEKSCNRAFAFRRATAEERRARVSEPWQEVDVGLSGLIPDLPFKPLDLAKADFAHLLADCRIDHGVAPVAHTRGGSQAGYRRWHQFKQQGLKGYARRRNNALADGVSRMSAYLHYGMVSPFRLAREAHEDGSSGAEKYLDELMIWRELAYGYCFHRPDHADISTLPQWARDTLEEHGSDPRPFLPTWEQLARAQTGDALWDAAQMSLLRRGELHNNVRMTWGKALVSWTPDAERALELLRDLNHRYALDGRDPASYGGLLWCLGQFDRPFTPARPILGTVRPRPTADHARRLEVGSWREKVSRSPYPRAPSVLIVGSGMAGLACARVLGDAGVPVTVVDKGRRPGGRLATRHRSPQQFDHGAQFFTARDPRFIRLVQSWAQSGLVAPWPDRVVELEAGEVRETRESERWVGTPGMNAVAAHLAADQHVLQSRRVVALERVEGHWRAELAEGETLEAEICVVTAPPPQSRELLADHAFAERLESVEIAPCVALMVEFTGPVEVDFIAALPASSGLSWIARDSSKPGRPDGERWVLHADPEWSREYLDRRDEAAEPLLQMMAEAVGQSLPTVSLHWVHAWRYARVTRPLGVDHLFDPTDGVGYAGDGCLGSRIEDAYLSGVALGGAILRSLMAKEPDLRRRSKGRA